MVGGRRGNGWLRFDRLLATVAVLAALGLAAVLTYRAICPPGLRDAAPPGLVKHGRIWPPVRF